MSRLLVVWLVAGAFLSPAVSAVGQRASSLHRLEPSTVLRALTFDESGNLAGPAARDFWDRVFRDDRVPDDPRRELGRVDADPLVDAAYVLAATCTGPPAAGRARLRAFAFVQRIAPAGGGENLPALLVAARAVMRYPMLMLSVERMAIDDLDVHAALARAARGFERIANPLRLRRALSQFQGAMALVERARLAGRLGPDAAGAALLALASVPLSRDGFDGAMADWLARDLLPRLEVPVTPSLTGVTMDQRLLAALAGPRDAETPVVEWEGLTYRFDRRTAQFERYVRSRTQLGGNSLDAVLALWEVADALAAGRVAVGDVPPLVEQLETSATVVRTPLLGLHVPGARSVPYAEEIEPLVDDLREITDRGRLRRLSGIAERLRYVVDVLLADLLRTLPYVVHLADAYGAETLGADVAARHEFGVRLADPGHRGQAPWAAPQGRVGPPASFDRIGEPWTAAPGEDRFSTAWHVYGSLLSLDLALAPLYLPRFAGVMPPEVPAFQGHEEEHFAQAVALFDPAAADGGQAASLAGTIRRGRARVRNLSAGAAGLADVADAAGLDPARRNDLAWVLRRRPGAVDGFFSRSELLWLGLRPRDGPPDRPPAGWGAPAVWPAGCLCTRMPLPDAEDLFRAPADRLASRFADLQLALAEAVDDMALPAPIVRDLLPIATREMLDGVQFTFAGRFDALARYVHELPRTRIEDYVAALVGPGRPLRPVGQNGGSGR